VRGEPAAVTIRAAAREAIETHADAERPRECCGVLIGTPDDILEARPVANIAPETTRYLLDPKGHIEARRDARRRGLAVIGFYHSHPRSVPVPSDADRNEATYEGHIYLIVGTSGDADALRGFRLHDGDFLEVPLVTRP
jgi:proteasome lid subunit RPN8/RPN11